MNLTWRIGQDGLAHAIDGCDELASAWVALCGKLITGPKETWPTIACNICVEKEKENDKP